MFLIKKSYLKKEIKVSLKSKMKEKVIKGRWLKVKISSEKVS